MLSWPTDVASGLAACREVRTSLDQNATGLSAPYAAVAAIEAGLQLPFDAGSRRERDLFADCVVSTQSKALRHLFFAEREATKVPDVTKDTPVRNIARAAVVGAGTMGGGIAMTYANAGIAVLLKDVTDTKMATIIAERLRAALDRELTINNLVSVKLSASLGVALHPLHGAGSPRALLDAADDAAYKAKRHGKNQVVVTPLPHID